MAKQKKPVQPGAAFLKTLAEPAPDLSAEEEESAVCGTGEEAVAVAMLKKAMKGDTAAAKFIMDVATKALPKEADKPEEFKLELVVIDNEN